MSTAARLVKISQELVIDNFLAKRDSLDGGVDSPTFTGGGQMTWVIRVFPRGIRGHKGFGAYLHLLATPKGLKTVVVDNIRVELKGDRQESLAAVNLSNAAMVVGSIKGLTIDEIDIVPVAESGKLIVSVSAFFNREDNEILPESFTKLPQSPHLTDFTIVSRTGRRVHTHKIVLATRIPEIFGKKFREEDVEVNQAKVNCSNDTIAALLEFLCANEISTPPTMELLKLATEWKMKRLVVICAHKLTFNLTIENVVNSHQIAVNWRISQLKMAAEKFIEEHKSEARQMVINGSYHSGDAIGHLDLQYDSDSEDSD